MLVVWGASLFFEEQNIRSSELQLSSTIFPFDLIPGLNSFAGGFEKVNYRDNNGVRVHFLESRFVLFAVVLARFRVRKIGSGLAIQYLIFTSLPWKIGVVTVF